MTNNPTLDYGVQREDLAAGLDSGNSRSVPSIDEKCSLLKIEYETCFNRWYSEKFLQNDEKTGTDECSSFFQKYQACLKEAIKKKGIDKLIEESQRNIRL